MKRKKKKVDKKVEAVIERTLTIEEMVKIQSSSHKNSLLKKDLELLELEIKLNECRSMLWKETAEVSRLKKLGKLTAVSDNKNKNDVFMKQLEEKYELKGSWGYDPTTGVLGDGAIND